MQEWELTDKQVEDALEYPTNEMELLLLRGLINEAQKKLVEWLIFKKMEGYTEHNGHHCFVVRTEALNELCRELEITQQK